MQTNPIGIFDSGIGGLTIANALRNKLPNENIIYFGDTAHLPYGEKSEQAIIDYSKKIALFLLKKNCKAIVIACNSASSVAINDIKKIARNVPVLNVITPVIKKVVKVCKDYNIGVIGTNATIQSNVYENQIKSLCSFAHVSSLATPLLAPMIEEGFANDDISNTIIEKYLSNKHLANIDHLILACTHYPLIYQKISNYYNGDVEIIDSTSIVTKHIFEQLKINNLLNNNSDSKCSFYVSNYTKTFEKSSKFFFKEDLKLEEMNIFL